MLTEKLFHTLTAAGAEWVLWLLIGLSVLSVTLMLERLFFFARNSYGDTSELMRLLSGGKLAEAGRLVESRRGMEAQVIRAALASAPDGADSVEEIVAGTIAASRPAYERSLSFLGTLGNNAPFLGLFGTVIGIIKAFSDLSVGAQGGGLAKGGGAASVMAGISEALVATAVGIFVAIPAVVAFNAFNRWLKTIINRSQAMGHALNSHLRREPRGGAASQPGAQTP